LDALSLKNSEALTKYSILNPTHSIKRKEKPMNHSNFLKMMVFVIVLALLLVSQQTVPASTRLEGAGEVPFYARLERGYTFTNGEWVAVIFYRPPNCIPPDFNLLNLFDFQSCWLYGPPTTDGFSIWKDPETDMAPIFQFLQGLGAVPVWFVTLSDYQAIVSDDVITIGELVELPSRKVGYASFYQETLRPAGGAVTNTMLIEAHGSLADGTLIKLQIEHTDRTFKVKIKF
jgi:hypothetical protein